MNKNPIQPIIVSKFPSYLKSEYPNFFRLLSDFYSWLDDNFVEHLSNHSLNSEVNSEIEPYVSMIMKEIGWDYALATPGDKKLVTNTLLDFYLSKGNEYSFEYLFRALFNDNVSIDYPRKRLFTLSSAEYRSDTTLLLSANSIGSSAFQYVTGSDNTLGITVYGYVSGQEENVNRITPVIYNQVQHLLVSIDGDKKFRPFETVHLDLNGVKIFEQVYNTVSLNKIIDPGIGYRRGDLVSISGADIKGLARVKNISSGSITGIDINSSGTGYRVGDPIIVDPSSVTRGFGFYGFVSMVSGTGAILETEITNSGYDYEEIPKLLVKSLNGNSAIISPIPYMIGGISEIEFNEPYWKAGDGIDEFPNLEFEITSSEGSGADISFRADTCVFESPKEFHTDQGVLGLNGVLHDSLYFQEYSYEVNSPVPPRMYQSVIDNSVHPAGLVRYIVFNHESPLNYNFNRLDRVKFNLRDSIESFLSLTFESEAFYRNISAVTEEVPSITLRSYSGESLESDLRTGLTFIRHWNDFYAEAYLSSQERIPSHFTWDTASVIDELMTGISFIRYHDSGQNFQMFGIRQPMHQINSDGINEVTIG